MTRIFMSADPVLGMVFDVAENVNEVQVAMEAALRARVPITFVKLTCVREGELGHLIWLRLDDIKAIEERDKVARDAQTARPRAIDIETSVPN